MSTQFACDLRMARRKAGYTQGDIAHEARDLKEVVAEQKLNLRLLKKACSGMGTTHGQGMTIRR